MEPSILTSVPLQILVDQIANAVIKSLSDESLTKKNDPLLTRHQTAKILQISLPTLNIWTKRGIIKAKRINSRVRYSESDVNSALQNYNKYGRTEPWQRL